MIHSTIPNFWRLYNALPADVPQPADKNYALLQTAPSHPSLQLKEIAA